MRLLAVVFASGLVGVMPAFAQITGGASCPAVRRALSGSQPQFIPYSLVRVRTMVQTLGNGTQVTTRTESHEWRDAQGRTRSEIWVQRNGETQLQNVNIFDPVLRQTIGLHPRVHVADVNRIPEPTMRPPRAVDEAYQKAMQPEYQQQGVPHAEFKSERLEPTVILGECAQGNRSTQTYPAGEIGNDAEIQVVTENWWSPRLGMQLRTVSDDPRAGHYVEEVTELHLDAPDSALFQIPPDYKAFDLTREPAQP